MFANLKNKLIEEVKASPSKFQQFAQAAVSSSSSSTPTGSDSTTTTTNENFFSITEEDTPQNSPFRPLRLQTKARNATPQNGSTTGAIPRTRKLSNSSMASDVSFRLPSYDAPAVYHLQSDLESEIGSEMDESASTTKFDVITKEQLFAAYKRSLERYNKYRCRYSDLSKKYKDLERDSTKARSVLVETQEKAIRRINELREQCALEQQAKAHLEEALRVEMDDMQCKIQAYQTKLKLLGENPEVIVSKINESAELCKLVDIDENVSTMAMPEAADTEKESEREESRLAELETQLRDREKQIKALTESLEVSRQEISTLRKQEEDNALLLAQTKQAIHTELESKESEVKKLKEKLKETQKSLDATIKKESKLNEQVGELADLREKLKQTVSAKQEIEAKLIASEHLYGTLKEQVAATEKEAKKYEDRIDALTKEHEQKLQDLRQQNVQLNEMLQRQQQIEVSRAEIDNESNLMRNENINLRATIAELERTIQESRNEIETQKQRIQELQVENSAVEQQLATQRLKTEELCKQLEEESAKRTQNGQRVKQLESELRILNEQSKDNESETVKALKQELHQTSADLHAELNSAREALTNKEKELKSLANKMAKQKKQHENQHNKLKEQIEELEKLRLESQEHAQLIQSLQKNAEEQKARVESEAGSLKAENASIEGERLKLEEMNENLRRESKVHQDELQRLSQQLKDAEQKIKQIESKMLSMQSENAQLAERNCLLEENAHRIEKALAEREREQTAEVLNTNALHSKLEAAEDAYSKLNEKMSQILDENSRMHNAQELMDHDHRTLQDKFDALEKEKLNLEDAQRCLYTELQVMQSEKETSDARVLQMGVKIKELTAQVLEQQQRADALDLDRKNLTQEKADIGGVLSDLEKQLAEVQRTQGSDIAFKDQLQTEILRLKNELEEQKGSADSNLREKQHVIDDLISKLNEAEARCSQADALERELSDLRTERTELKEEIDKITFEITAKDERISDLQEKFKALENMENLKSDIEKEKASLLNELSEQKSVSEAKQIEFEKLKSDHLEIIGKLSAAENEISSLKSKEQQFNGAIEEIRQQKEQVENMLNDQLKTANSDIEKLHENNVAFQVEIEQLKNRNMLDTQELEKSLKGLQDEYGKLQTQLTPENQQKVAKYDDLMIENEFLNKNCTQLEEALQQQREEFEKRSKEMEGYQEKLKSLQCELYVLKENAAGHVHEISVKEQETLSFRSIVEQLNAELDQERSEVKRQNEHAQYLTQQNDNIQKELLQARQQLSETTQALHNLQKELVNLKTDSKEQLDRQESELEKLRTQLQTSECQAVELEALKVQLEELKDLEKSHVSSNAEAPAIAESAPKAKLTDHNSDMERLRSVNEQLQTELEDLRHRSSSEISSLEQEVEDLQNNSRHMADRIMELERLRAGLQAQKLFSADVRSGGVLAAEIPRASDSDKGNDHNDNISYDNSKLAAEKAELEQKLKEIVNDVRDVSDRNVFLEQKCENYLILEQSNERLKSQNAKLARQLDETLVSMQHNENITANTEFEYLRNIMFQYLTGSASGNNETLVKVISAVLKFSPQQTQVALEKEHQRRSLINKIL